MLKKISIFFALGLSLSQFLVAAIDQDTQVLLISIQNSIEQLKTDVAEVKTTVNSMKSSAAEARGALSVRIDSSDNAVKSTLEFVKAMNAKVNEVSNMLSEQKKIQEMAIQKVSGSSSVKNFLEKIPSLPIESLSGSSQQVQSQSAPVDNFSGMPAMQNMDPRFALAR